MILIIGLNNTYDQGTESVIEWLDFYHANYLKIDLCDLYFGKINSSLYVSNGRILYRGINILEDVNVIFYRRRGVLNLFDENPKLNRELSNEMQAVVNYLFYLLRGKLWFPNNSLISKNKLIQLDVAKKCNICIPETLVTSNKIDLLDFYENNKPIINKPINYCGYHKIDGKFYTSNAVSLCKKEIMSLPDLFPLSFFQEYIASNLELRCFYCDGDIYSVAIHVEISKYVDVKLSRSKKLANYSIYNISEYDRCKIKNMMNLLNLNTGSIDFIEYGGQLYFLEINPMGQFLFESEILNLGLDQKIAEWLINKDV